MPFPPHYSFFFLSVSLCSISRSVGPSGGTCSQLPPPEGEAKIEPQFAAMPPQRPLAPTLSHTSTHRPLQPVSISRPPDVVGRRCLRRGRDPPKHRRPHKCICVPSAALPSPSAGLARRVWWCTLFVFFFSDESLHTKNPEQRLPGGPPNPACLGSPSILLIVSLLSFAP